MAKGIKSNKKGFYKDISQKKKAKESVPPINEKRELATADMEKAQVLSEFFASHFSGCQASCVS